MKAWIVFSSQHASAKRRSKWPKVYSLSLGWLCNEFEGATKQRHHPHNTMQDLPSCFMLANILQFATSLLPFSPRSLWCCVKCLPLQSVYRYGPRYQNWLHLYTAGLLWSCQIERTLTQDYADARLYVLSALKTMCAWLDFQSDGMLEERKVLSDCTLWIHFMHYTLTQDLSKFKNSVW